MGRRWLWRLRLLAWAFALVPLSSITLVLAILGIVGTALITVWVGIPIVLGTVALTRPIARIYRNFVADVLGTRIESPYLPWMSGGPLALIRGLIRDPATWRDALWLLINGTVGLALSIAALIECLLDLIFWFVPGGLLVRTQAYLARALLTPTDRALLARRVRELTASRAVTVDAQASEIRRIERDLHDGAQARLVALGMNIGMAENAVDLDPAAAKAMLAEARNTSIEALADLRGLVRGIHPPVLADRGLVGAVQALALASPVPITIKSDVPERLPAPVESAAYFAVSEALANMIKHASAQEALVLLHHTAGLLIMQVTDDGIGGANLDAGTGLRGIARRLDAFDGTLVVTSPPGGPTVVTMELPCVSSSPKILPSSGTV